MHPVRVVQIVAAVEGAIWFVDICVGLRARGYDVAAVVGGEGPLADALRRAGITVHTSPLHLTPARVRAHRLGPLWRVFTAFHVIRSAVELAFLLRRLRPDVTQTHVFAATVIGRVAAWLARVPVRTAMVPGPYHLESPMTRRIDRASWWMETVIVGGSRAVEEHYRSIGVPADRRCHVYYGPDADRFDPAEHDGRLLRAELEIAPDSPLVGQVAHFYRYVHGPWASAQTLGRDIKGHDLLVRAARLIRDVRPDVQFAFVGGPFGPLGDEVLADTRALADELGVGDAIHFVGHREDIPGALAALDVAVQCSRSENLGGTIESLLMERPTVATAVGGMPESVIDGETGLIVEPDDAEALARAILRLLGEPELGARLATEGRRRMLAGFTSRKTVDDLDSLFQGLLAGAR